MRLLLTLILILFHGIAFGATASSLSQWGITWNFDKAYEYGTYANGDYWVKTDSSTGYVRVTSISPATSTYDGERVHGWEVNPGISQHSFDGRTNNKYNASLMPSLPYNAKAGDSLVKAISLIPCDNSVCRPALKTVSVLTVVSSVPPNNGSTVFRPPYVGSSKPLYSTSSIRWDRIPNYASVPYAPTLDWIVNRIGKVQFDHVAGIYGGQTRPKDHLYFYGADINQEHGDAVLRLMLNDSQAAKTAATIAVVQGGIDHYYFILNGQTWPRGSGEQPGRIILPLFASYVLDDPEMQQVVTARSADTHYPYEQYILARRSNSNNRVLWGDTTGSESVYWDKLESSSNPGSATIRDPYGYIDGGRSPGSAYQLCCTSQGFKQTALIMVLMPGLQSIWDFSDEVIEYADRWVTHGTWTLPDPCAPVEGIRGVHYGPDPNKPGDCIRGSGRFPSRHGTEADGGARYSNFAAAMWDAYYDSPTPPPSDTTPPVIQSITVPPSSTELVNPVTISATDNVGVTHYAVSLGATPPSSSSSDWRTTSTISFTFPGYGTYVVNGWARDAAGNVSVMGTSNSITISNYIPLLAPTNVRDFYSDPPPPDPPPGPDPEYADNPPPSQSEWSSVLGTIVARGSSGSSDRYLDGICDIEVFGGYYNLYYLAGSAVDTGSGVRYTALHLARCPVTSDPRNSANWTKYSGNPIIENWPSGEGVDWEEGVFEVAAAAVDGTLHMMVGVKDDAGGSAVDMDIYYYSSTNGYSFTNHGIALARNESGLPGTERREIWPVEMWHYDDKFHLIYVGEAASSSYRVYYVNGASPDNWDISSAFEVSNDSGNVSFIRGETKGYYIWSDWDDPALIRSFNLDNMVTMSNMTNLGSYTTAVLGKGQAKIWGDTLNDRWLLIHWTDMPKWWEDYIQLRSNGSF